MERVRIVKHDYTITTVEEWFKWAPPKANYQWDPERSAYELARAWCEPDGPRMPDQLRRLLDSRIETRGPVVEQYLPEHRIRFDSHRGEPRNADMAFVGRTSVGKVAVTIEAKADEPFGGTVAETLSDAVERLIETPRSRGIQRIQDLTRALFGVRLKKQPKVGALRYQLLTAVAGSLAYAIANDADTAALVIHEFRTCKTNDTLHEVNAQDLDDFLLRLGGVRAGKPPLENSFEFVGPFTVPGAPLFDKPPPLLIGKIVTDRRVAAPVGMPR